MNLVIVANRLCAILVLLFCSCAFAAAQSGRAASDIAGSFSKFDLVRIDTAGSKLKFDAAGRNIDIALKPHDMRTANYRAENTGEGGNTAVERLAVNTFIGTVNGNLSSNSRISIVNSKVEGYFEANSERYFIEPAGNYSSLAATDEYVVYRVEDAIRTGQFSCGSQLIDKIERGKELAANGVVASPLAPKRIELATEADFEYVNTLGSVALANAEILGILNTVEGLYVSELDLSIGIVFQHSWTTADPFAAANTEIAVRNFQAFWNANYPLTTTPRDAAHLFSGKANLQSQGWGFIGVICNSPSFAYGMSGYINWSPGRYLITAHELGHNLGANHVETAHNCGNSLMNAQLTGVTPLTFCQYSRDEVSTYIVNSGSCLTSPAACKFDFDGDAKADISIFRPAPGEWWYLRSSDGGNRAAHFGASTDIITPADFTGDGKTDIAFWRPSTGFWYVLRSEDSSFFAFPFGTNGDTPVPADFDGDNKTDAAVYRPSTNTWFIPRSGDGGTTITQFGVAGDVPVTADYDGDGKSDIAIFRPGLSQWWIARTTAGLKAVQFGAAGDKTVAGDYTGDGKADVAVWRPSNGVWSVLRSENGSFYSFPFGANGDVPSPADYDGDGKFDPTVFRPSTSIWYASGSTAGTIIRQFGINGDAPLANAFVR